MFNQNFKTIDSNQTKMEDLIEKFLNSIIIYD